MPEERRSLVLGYRHATDAVFLHERTHGYPDPELDLRGRLSELHQLQLPIQRGRSGQSEVLKAIYRIRLRHLKAYALRHENEVPTASELRERSRGPGPRAPFEDGVARLALGVFYGARAAS